MAEEEAHRTIGEIVKRARKNSAKVKTAPKRIVTTETQGKCGKYTDTRKTQGSWGKRKEGQDRR